MRRLNGIRSIAFPATSCSVYGYPVDQAARIAVEEVTAFLRSTTVIERVEFWCFGRDVLEAYRHELARIKS